jgi:hypothetical protein
MVEILGVHSVTDQVGVQRKIDGQHQHAIARNVRNCRVRQAKVEKSGLFTNDGRPFMTLVKQFLDCSSKERRMPSFIDYLRGKIAGLGQYSWGGDQLLGDRNQQIEHLEVLDGEPFEPLTTDQFMVEATDHPKKQEIGINQQFAIAELG